MNVTIIDAIIKKAEALRNYLAEYEKVGICPKHFESVIEFVGITTKILKIYKNK